MSADAGDEQKLRIFYNTNIAMSRGKLAAHAVHAALTAFGVHPDIPVVVLGAKPRVIEQMRTHIRDAGRTELEPGTLTTGTDYVPADVIVRPGEGYEAVIDAMGGKAIPTQAGNARPRELDPLMATVARDSATQLSDVRHRHYSGEETNPPTMSVDIGVIEGIEKLLFEVSKPGVEVPKQIIAAVSHLNQGLRAALRTVRYDEPAGEYEWSVARQSIADGELWDVQEQNLGSIEAARHVRDDWAGDVEGDPVVVVRRRKIERPAWEVVG